MTYLNQQDSRFLSLKAPTILLKRVGRETPKLKSMLPFVGLPTEALLRVALKKAWLPRAILPREGLPRAGLPSARF